MAEADYSWASWGKLDTNSRSLSTWVAVGDTEDTTNSQLPSPHVELRKVSCLIGHRYNQLNSLMFRVFHAVITLINGPQQISSGLSTRKSGTIISGKD